MRVTCSSSAESTSAKLSNFPRPFYLSFKKQLFSSFPPITICRSYRCCYHRCRFVHFVSSIRPSRIPENRNQSFFLLMWECTDPQLGEVGLFSIWWIGIPIHLGYSSNLFLKVNYFKVANLFTSNYYHQNLINN
jgi:hypothetical protein